MSAQTAASCNGNHLLQKQQHNNRYPEIAAPHIGSLALTGAPELPLAFFKQLLGLRPLGAKEIVSHAPEGDQIERRRQVRIEFCGKDTCNGIYTKATPHTTCFKCKKGFCEPCSNDNGWLIRHSTEFIQTRDDIATEAEMQLQRDYNYEKNKVRANLQGRPYPSRKHVWIQDIDSDDDIMETNTSRTNHIKEFHEYCRNCCDGTANCTQPLQTPAYDLAQDDKSVISFLLCMVGFKSREQVETLMIKAAMEHEIQLENKKTDATTHRLAAERAQQEALMHAGRQYYREKSERAAHKQRMAIVRDNEINEQEVERWRAHYYRNNARSSRSRSRSRSRSITKKK